MLQHLTSNMEGTLELTCFVFIYLRDFIFHFIRQNYVISALGLSMSTYDRRDMLDITFHRKKSSHLTGLCLGLTFSGIQGKSLKILRNYWHFLRRRHHIILRFIQV